MKTISLTENEIAILAQLIDSSPVKGVQSMLAVLAIVKKLEEAMNDTGNREREETE